MPGSGPGETRTERAGTLAALAHGCDLPGLRSPSERAARESRRANAVLYPRVCGHGNFSPSGIARCSPVSVSYHDRYNRLTVLHIISSSTLITAAPSLSSGPPIGQTPAHRGIHLRMMTARKPSVASVHVTRTGLPAASPHSIRATRSWCTVTISRAPPDLPAPSSQ